MSRKTFPATLSVLRDMLTFVYEAALHQGFSQKEAMKVMLAAEEALVNVIHYSYVWEQGLIEINCDKSPELPGICISIKDQGLPFNFEEKLQQAYIKRLFNFDSNTMGGYGIFIYTCLMDHVKYYQVEEGNVLVLIKYL